MLAGAGSRRWVWLDLDATTGQGNAGDPDALGSRSLAVLEPICQGRDLGGGDEVRGQRISRCAGSSGRLGKGYSSSTCCRKRSACSRRADPPSGTTIRSAVRTEAEPMHGFKTATAQPSGAHEATGLSAAAGNVQFLLDHP